jgi:multiple sugar transport system permease protein
MSARGKIKTENKIQNIVENKSILLTEKEKRNLKIRARIMKISGSVLLHFLLVLVLVIVLVPYLWMVSGSFKSSIELQTANFMDPDPKNRPRWIPKTPTFEHYDILHKRRVPVLNFLGNSLIMAFGTTAICILFSIFASYAMSRLRFKWKKAYEVTLYSTQMFPGISFVIPYFILFLYMKRYLGIPMQNTYHGMIITYATFALPFSILMMKNYLDSIPVEIDEQAMIDGCNKIQIIFRIIFPLSLPGMVSVGIFSFIMSWNEMLFASVLTNAKIRPVSLGLMDFITINTADWGGMLAACVIVTIPVLIIFIFFQKYIVEGLASSSVKG